MFTNSVDPRAIVTVGDQVVSEHVFAFHARESTRSGFSPVVSRLAFSPSDRRVVVEPAFALKTSDGRAFTHEQICRSLKASFDGTHHAPYSALIRSIDCGSAHGKIVVALRKIPINLRFLFTLPDFSIFDPARVPIRPATLNATTGPYSVAAMTRDRVDLVRNAHYPRTLVANTVGSVRLHAYPASRTNELIAASAPDAHNMIYLYGYALTTAEVKALERKGYVVETYPDEWLIRLGFGKSVPSKDRETLKRVVDENRLQWLVDAPFGKPAYSILPADTPYGLSESECSKAAAPRNGSRRNLSTTNLVTMRAWYGVPLFKTICSTYQRRFPTLKIRLVDTFDELSRGENDFHLTPLGISCSDPLTHLSFLANTVPEFRERVPLDEIAEVSVSAEASSFENAVKKFERRVLEKRIVVPIAHFPGLVAHAPRFERDEDLAFSWGIQTWSYRVR